MYVYTYIHTQKYAHTDIKHPFSNTWKKESMSFPVSCYNIVSQAYPKIIKLPRGIYLHLTFSLLLIRA